MATISPRVLLTDFALANPVYAEASISVYAADTSTWLTTPVLAPLYTSPTSSDQHGNPIRLDGDGKYKSQVYVDRPVISRVTKAAVPDHDTGVAGLQPAFRGDWTAATDYNLADVAKVAASGKLYMAAVTHTSGGAFADDLAAGNWVLYVDSSTPTDYADVITQAETGYFFASDGARINRMADRLFLGTAVRNDGSSLGGGGGADWFSAGTGSAAGLSWVHYAASVALTVPSGKVGFAAASRASDVPVGYGSSQTSIPFVGVAIMDRVGTGPPYWTSYAAYLEARIENGTIGTVIGLEIDAVNFGGAAGQSTPWRRQTLDGATALWLASGGDPANHGRSVGPAQLAIGVVNNGAKFQSGLVFANDAIDGTDGASGFGDAVLLSTRHILGWWADDGSTGERVNYITSTATAPAHSLQFQDGATLYLSADGEIDFSVANVAGSVNGIGIVPAVTGGTPYINSFGEPDRDVKIWPGGDGNLALWCEQIIFHNDSGHQMAGVLHSVTDDDNFNTLEFADSGPFFYGMGGVIAAFGMVANPVGSIAFSNAASGNPVSIAAQGAGDIDILLDPGGTNGTLKLAIPSVTSATIGAASALPGVPAGYFKVKDAGGTSRVIPYWNP